MRSLLLVVGVVCLSVGASTARAADKIDKRLDCSLGPATLRTLAVQHFKSNGSGIEFYRALDKEVGLDTAFLNVNLSIGVLKSDALWIDVPPPYWAYRFLVGEAIRKRESIANVVVPRGVAVNVSPSQIDSADIVKVILERDVKRVTPLASSEKPTIMATQLGMKKTLH